MELQVGVKALLKNKEGQYLIVKRSAQKYGVTRGTWDIVGGRINPGSSLLDNLKREIREETALDLVGDCKLVGAQDIFPAKDPDRHVVRLTYVANVSGEIILDTSENTEYKWVSLEELRKHDDLDVYLKGVVDTL